MQKHTQPTPVPRGDTEGEEERKGSHKTGEGYVNPPRGLSGVRNSKGSYVATEMILNCVDGIRVRDWCFPLQPLTL